MFQSDAVLVERRPVARDTWVLAFDAPEIAAATSPGQFVEIGLRGPLLRRPFSIYRAGGGRVEVILKGVGAGTSLLCEMRVGDPVSLLGPLGHGFEIDPGWRRVGLVSGGLGVAALPLAAEALRRSGVSVLWAHGARSAADLCSEWTGDEVLWATEDGSQGYTGRVLDALPEGLDGILACGPNAMLAAVATRWPAAQVALETYMGCGTGVCLGCAVPRSAGGYDRACKEGPVYRAADVDWPALPSRMHYAVDR